MYICLLKKDTPNTPLYPILQNRGSEKQKPKTNNTTNNVFAGNTNAQQQQQAAAAKKKKSKKKKKTKGGEGGAPDVSEEKSDPKKNVDMTAVRVILKKFNMEGQDEMEVYNAVTSTNQSRKGSGGGGFMTGSQRMERQFLLELAHDNFKKLAEFVDADASAIPEPTFVAKTNDPPTVASVLSVLFHFMKKDETNTPENEGDKENEKKAEQPREQLWTLLDDATTSPILKAALSSSVESLKWFEKHASDALEAFANQQVLRERDVTVLLDAGVSVSAKSVAVLFSRLPDGAGHPLNNNLARLLCHKSSMFMQKKSDFNLVMDSISKTVGKQGRTDVNAALKEAKMQMLLSKANKRSPQKVVSLPSGDSPTKKKNVKELTMKEKKAQEENEKRLAALKLKTSKITGALQWYNQLLDDLNATAASVVDSSGYDESDDEDEEKKEDDDTIKVKEESSLIKNRPKNALTAEQVMAALEKCDSDELLEDIDTKIGKITYLFSVYMPF